MPALAEFVAVHPFASFALVMALSLALSGGGWLLVQRLRLPLWRWSARTGGRLLAWPPLQAWLRRHPRLPHPALFSGTYLFFDLLAGFGMALGAAGLFLEVADETGLDETLGRFDELLAMELRRHVGAEALRAFALLTRIADTAVITAICVAVALLLVWRGRRTLAACWVAAVAGNGLLTQLLKAAFGRTRPLHEHGWIVEQGWSFPSGHASSAMATYGMLTYLLLRSLRPIWHLPVLLAAIALILLVGYSRIVLQVHYFSDVLAGFASAAAWLIVCIAAAELLRLRQSTAQPAEERRR